MITNLTNPGQPLAEGDRYRVDKPNGTYDVLVHRSNVTTVERNNFTALSLVNLVLTDTDGNVIAPFAGQHPVNENQVYKLIGTIVDSDSTPYVLPAPIRAGLDVICSKGASETDHLYFHPNFDEFGGFEMLFKLPSSGNWMITAERQNKGLDFMGADFRFYFSPFDLKCRQVIGA